jgi:hypothetical protein
VAPESEEASLFTALDWLSLAGGEAAGLFVEDGAWQDIVHNRKTQHARMAKRLCFFMHTLLFLLVVIISRVMEDVNNRQGFQCRST